VTFCEEEEAKHRRKQFTEVHETTLLCCEVQRSAGLPTSLHGK